VIGSVRAMEADGYLNALLDRSGALLVAAHTDLEAPVPSCPGWTVTDLITHVGRTWGWAASIVRTGGRSDLPGVPEEFGEGELLEWAEDRAQQVIGALAVADPESNCWTFGLPRSRLFWFRRQALETAVHAWDGQLAFGLPEPIDPELARDGVAEFLEQMLPRQIKRNPDDWTGQSVLLHCTDGDGDWTVRLGPGPTITVERAAAAEADVTLNGPSSSIYLWCLNRLPTDDLERIGDGAVADRWTTKIAF